MGEAGEAASNFPVVALGRVRESASLPIVTMWRVGEPDDVRLHAHLCNSTLCSWDDAVRNILSIRPQDGTPLKDRIFASALCGDGSVVLAGYSEGDWAEANAGGSDLAAVKLDAAVGTEIWRWQVRPFCAACVRRGMPWLAAVPGPLFMESVIGQQQ